MPSAVAAQLPDVYVYERSHRSIRPFATLQCNLAIYDVYCVRTRAHAIVPSAVCVSQLTSSYTSVTYTVLEAPNNEHSSVYL